jgi:hypothetical protein
MDSLGFGRCYSIASTQNHDDATFLKGGGWPAGVGLVQGRVFWGLG